ncbi:dual oxidase maturation factor 1 [Syngnathoides biaculeatus]|uniref:dual oxidase maturation factor 1 n=1 Tax=Syngnathoides biaculeatus TaxID=300417 RepID=UPI002ADD4A98|nr:dual oxidase maturation factor 1 [Syngnathoides biaculeatus]XP_061679110.1 dual oxidase maturation factor 1 [Syngnathoides biaculeatus]
MTLFDNIYPFYHMRRTSFIFSGHLFTVIVCFVVLTLCLLLILPGIRGKSRLLWLFRILLSFYISAVIVALNFTNTWAEARMMTNTTYKSFSNALVNADIGLHVGLYGINVTLKGNPVVQLNETIDYNEMFSWSDTIEQEYKEALAKGLPNPILYIAEKFTLSSPCGLIFHYRHSGQYASATLWTAFCCWMLANILLYMPVILYAGYMMLATAAFIFISTATFSSIMHASQCVFSIGAVSFEIEYSFSFWLALATGVLCTVVGVLVVIMNFMVPEKIKEAFSVGVDSWEDEDVSYGQTHRNPAFIDDVTVSPCPFTEVTVEEV